MAVRQVLELGNPQLRLRAESMDPSSPQLFAIVADLRDTLRHWRETTGYGRAIAAPQIGSRARVIYLEMEAPLVMINAEIIGRSKEEIEVWDACLSFLTFFFVVRRHREIRVRYYDLDGSTCEIDVDDERSELLQHEIDHLDGILAVDRMVDVASMCTRSEFERRHRHESPYAR